MAETGRDRVDFHLFPAAVGIDCARPLPAVVVAPRLQHQVRAQQPQTEGLLFEGRRTRGRRKPDDKFDEPRKRRCVFGCVCVWVWHLGQSVCADEKQVVNETKAC